jgi:2-haloacid dehalogenase
MHTPFPEETNRSSTHPQAAAACVPVFDLGGVLFDWSPRHLFRRFFPDDPDALEKFLEEIDFWNWNAAMDAGRPVADAVREWAEKFPRYADAIRAFDARWEDIIAGPVPGTPALLDRLMEKGIPLYALSNISAEKLPILASRYAVLERFERIVISAEIGVNKPDSRLFAYFLEQTGRRKEELLFVDDSAGNVAGARRAGWAVIQFTDAAALAEELAARGIL